MHPCTLMKYCISCCPSEKPPPSNISHIKFLTPKASYMKTKITPKFGSDDDDDDDDDVCS
jgi:hypothetical protein